MSKKSLVLLLSLVAMAALSVAARDFPAAAAAAATGGAAYQPNDYFYDNPWLPPIITQLGRPWIPYVGPNVGFPPLVPSPPAAGNPAQPQPQPWEFPFGPVPIATDCGPFVPPAFCAYLPHPAPAAPATPDAPPAQH